ncbi:MAG: hypothetical protein R3C49_17895 [Planctomycetaceae bacterium]
MLRTPQPGRLQQTFRGRRIVPTEPTWHRVRELSEQIPTDDHPWKLGRVPNGYWDLREHRVSYLAWLGNQIGFLRTEDWYELRKQHFQNHFGGGLFRNVYRSSVLKAMQEFQPDVDWKPWLFGGAPKGYWKIRDNRCRYLQWLAERLNLRTTEDWYHVTGSDLIANSGGGLLNNEFRGSLQAVLADFRPDFEWQPWCFASVPQCFWSSRQNRQRYLTWLGQKLGFQSLADWSRLRRDHFQSHHGNGLFVGHYRGSVERALREVRPICPC